MEYLGGGSALDMLKPGLIEEIDIAIIIREILKGLDYLHSEKKLHRDIKGFCPTFSILVSYFFSPTINHLCLSFLFYFLLFQI